MQHGTLEGTQIKVKTSQRAIKKVKTNQNAIKKVALRSAF